MKSNIIPFLEVSYSSYSYIILRFIYVLFNTTFKMGTVLNVIQSYSILKVTLKSYCSSYSGEGHYYSFHIFSY